MGSFCMRCGSAFKANDVFCSTCGAARVVAGPTAGSAGSSPAMPGGPSGRGPVGAAQVVSRAYGAAAQAAALAGTGLAMPWQRLTGAAMPDIGALLSAAALPGAQRAIRASSLKRPAAAMMATTLLDVVVAVVTGGTSALYKALPRLILGLVTSVLSLATGSKAGRLRVITGAVGAATAAAQLGFAAYTLCAGFDDGTSWYALAPQVVAMVSAFIMACKTVAVAARRQP